MEAIIFFCILFTFFAFNVGTDYFTPKWWFFTQFTIALLAYNVYLHSGIMLSLFLFYMMTSSAYYSINTTSKHPAKAKNNPSFNLAITKSLVISLSFSLVFILIDYEFIDNCMIVFPFLLTLSSLYALLPKKMRKMLTRRGRLVEMFGFGGNSSVDATFRSLLGMACLYWFEQFPILIGVVTVLNLFCILKAKASAGLGGYVAGLSYYFIVHLGYWYGLAVVPVFLFCVMLYMGKKSGGNEERTWDLFHLSGRDWMVKFMWKELWKFRPNIFTGLGVGSFLNMAHTIQIVKKELFQGGVFLWLHCDVIQLVIEGGFIGLILCLGAFVEASLCLNPIIIAYGLCWLVNSATNFPNHMAPDSFVTLIVLKLAYR